MASPLTSRFWLISLVVLVYLQISFCDEHTQQAGGVAGQSAAGVGGQSESDPADIIARALTCLSDQYVYSSCQQSYRLSAEGCINVPPTEVDHYCGGPCLLETKLVLDCVNNILYNFKFYNGATVEDVKYTLDNGCSHGSNRGNFDVQQHLGGGGQGDYYYNYGNANKSPSFMYSVPLSSVVAAFFLF